MLLDRHAGGGSLGIVDDGVDAAKLLDRLVDDVLHDGLVVLTSGNVSLNGKDLNAVLGLQALLGGLELGNVAAGDDEVGALLGEGDVDAITDGTSTTVLERGLTATGDDNDLAVKHTHVGLPY